MQKKLVAEAISYRIGDILIGTVVTTIIAYLGTGEVELSAEIGLGAALLENMVNTIWYYYNVKIWKRN